MSEIDDKPKGEVAPVPTVTIQCAGPGPAHTFEWVRRSGPVPKLCDRHRKKKSVERSELVHIQRKAMAAKMKSVGDQTGFATRLLRLACGMRVFVDDLTLAAQWGGVLERGQDLLDLAAMTRKLFPDVVEGAMRSAAVAAETISLLLVLDGLERREELPAKDITMLSRGAIELSHSWQPDGPTHNFISFELSITPCPADGKLTEEQRAKVQGRIKPGDEDPNE